MYTIIVLEFVVLDRFCWNYNYFGTYLPTLPNKIINGLWLQSMALWFLLFASLINLLFIYGAFQIFFSF